MQLDLLHAMSVYCEDYSSQSKALRSCHGCILSKRTKTPCTSTPRFTSASAECAAPCSYQVGVNPTTGTQTGKGTRHVPTQGVEEGGYPHLLAVRFNHQVSTCRRSQCHALIIVMILHARRGG